MTGIFHYEHVQTATEEEFVEQGAELLEQGITEAIAERGHCILGLSGGSTPGPIYRALAMAPHAHSLPPFDVARAEHSRSAQGKRGERTIDWSKVSLFLVDERYPTHQPRTGGAMAVRGSAGAPQEVHGPRAVGLHVPKDHEESNQHLLQETLLAHAKIPRSNLVFPKTSLSIENCVADYEERLRALLAEAPPDIVVLGMGEDGHVASLFPGDKEASEERRRIVVHTQKETPCEVVPQYTPVPELRSVRGAASILQTSRLVSNRISITLPLLASARSMLFFLKGKGKKKIFEEMMKASFDPIRFPAHVLLKTGRTMWLTFW